MKTIKKLIAFVLVLAITAGMLAFGVSAEEAPYVMVNFGDSMSQGYALADYDYNLGGTGENLSKMSYPHLMKGWLEDKLDRDVTAYHFTFQGMRPNELYGILDHANNPELDVYTDNYLGYYENWFEEGCKKDYPELASYDFYTGITECVKKADLITVDMGMNNFGMYLVKRLGEVMAGGTEVSKEYADHFSKIITAYNPLYGAIVEAVRVEAAKLLTAYDAAFADAVIDAVLYTYGSFILYFDRSMELLRKLNPDAMVIVVGTFNCFPDMTADFNGTSLDVGTIVGLLFGSMNVYMTEMSELRYWYKFADCFSGVETFLGELQSDAGANTRSVMNAIIEDAYLIQAEGEADVSAIVKNNLDDDFVTTFAVKVAAADALAKRDPDYDTKAASLEAAAEKVLILEAFNAENTDADNEYFAAVRTAFGTIIEAYNAAARAHYADLAGIFAGGEFDYDGVLAAGGKSSDTASCAALVSHFIMGRSCVGMHPSPLGAAQKFNYVKKAYDSKFAANGEKYEKVGDVISGIFPDIGNIFSIITSAILSLQNLILLRFGGIFKALKLNFKILP